MKYPNRYFIFVKVVKSPKFFFCNILKYCLSVFSRRFREVLFEVALAKEASRVIDKTTLLADLPVGLDGVCTPALTAVVEGLVGTSWKDYLRKHPPTNPLELASQTAPQLSNLAYNFRLPIVFLQILAVHFFQVFGTYVFF